MRKSWPLAALIFIGLHTGVRADDWPNWMGPARDGLWNEQGVVEKLPAALTPKWRVPIKYGYAGPAVANGLVYVFDYDTSDKFINDPGARGKLKGKERLLCLDAKTGEQKWKHEYDCAYDVSYPGGPRATPTISGDKVYTLGAMGDFSCVDAATGKQIFHIDLKEKFGAQTQIWGFASHPFVHADKVYLMVGGSGSGVVAFNKDTGEPIWKKLDVEEPGYAPVALTEAGGRKQLLVTTPKNVHGMDPETGEQFWSIPFEPAYGMSICAPQREGDVLFTAGEGDKAVAIKLASDKPAAEELWRGQSNTAVYPVCGTPLAYQGHVYGVCTNGELRCVDLKTGKRVWSDLKPIAGGKRKGSGSAFIVRNGDRFYIASETGELIVAKLTPEKYTELSRAKLIEPTSSTWGRQVVWSHPAYADKCIFARNDKEILCVSLAAE